MDWSSLDHWLATVITAVREHWTGGDDRAVVASGPMRPAEAASFKRAVIVSPVPSVRIGPEADSQEPARTPVVVGPSPSVRVEPLPRSVWDDLGWTERIDGSQRTYEGAYIVTYGSGRATFRGRIVERRGRIAAYIADPPSAIKRHRKGPCFQLVEMPWFKVHWHRPPGSVDDAILYVQRILHEVLN